MPPETFDEDDIPPFESDEDDDNGDTALVLYPADILDVSNALNSINRQREALLDMAEAAKDLGLFGLQKKLETACANLLLATEDIELIFDGAPADDSAEDVVVTSKKVTAAADPDDILASLAQSRAELECVAVSPA